MNNTYALVLILVIALVTALLRFLPFLLLGNRKTPEFVDYLGKVLPFAVMAMLVVYCLKDINMGNAVLQLVSVLVVVGMHLWKKNTLFSIVAGTLCYMVLMRIM